jgi:hypothetical protein
MDEKQKKAIKDAADQAEPVLSEFERRRRVKAWEAKENAETAVEDRNRYPIELGLHDDADIDPTRAG